MRRTWLLIGMLGLLPGSALLAAVSGGPTILQTLERTDMPRTLAVSPNGQQIAVVTDLGLSVYRLKSDGTIRDTSLVHFESLLGLKQVAFGPGGKKIIATGDGGVIHFINRDTWVVKTLDLGLGRTAVATSLYLIESPTLLFATFWGQSGVYVGDYGPPTPAVTKLTTGLPTLDSGRSVVARADASRVFCCLTIPEGTDTKLYGVPNTPGNFTTWQYSVPGKVERCCVGPDVNHVLVTASDSAGLYIADQLNNTVPIVACYLNGAKTPRDVALTNDGLYAVVSDPVAFKVYVIAGVDLRGRLDPNFYMPPKAVRTASVGVQQQMTGLALHPTRPLAYVCAEYGHQVLTIKLALP